MINRLNGCRALVVGCNSQVAAAITTHIAKQNAAHVVGTYLPGAEHTGAGIESVRDRVSQLTEFSAFALDQTDVNQVRQVLEQAQQAMGGLDVVVTAAARQWDGGDSMDMSDDEFDAQIAVNLAGPMRIFREAAKRMMAQCDAGDKRHRAMCAIASVRGTQPLVDHPYDAAKAGMIHFVRAFARRLGPYGIKIGAIAPGTVDVDLELQRHDCPHDEYVGRWKPLTPLGGAPVSPELVAEETVILLNSIGDTGEVRHVDGGFNHLRPLPKRAGQ